MRPGRAADHLPPSSAAVMEEYSYTSTHPLGHTGPVTGSLYLSHIQSVAEIVKHFKILVTCFSDRVSRSAGICTEAVTFRFIQHGALGVGERVCAVELFIRTGSITDSARISP